MEDLPVELWLEILSYLPRTSLHKLMGVSRVLFELALDDIYQEIEFFDGENGTRKMFSQMQ